MVQMMVRPYLGTPAWCCLTCRPLLELVLVSTQRRTFPLGQVLWYSGYCRAHVLFFFPFILSLQLFAPFYSCIWNMCVVRADCPGRLLSASLDLHPEVTVIHVQTAQYSVFPLLQLDVHCMRHSGATLRPTVAAVVRLLMLPHNRGGSFHAVQNLNRQHVVPAGTSQHSG